MPNYYGTLGHRNQTIWLSVGVAVGSGLLALKTGNAALLVTPLGVLTGLRINPDRGDLTIFRPSWLDQAFLLDELQKEIPHRSRYSHTPIVGTTLRVIVPTALYIMGIVVASAIWEDIWLTAFWCWLYWYVGLNMADALHVLADVIDSKWKRVKRGLFSTR